MRRDSPSLIYICNAKIIICRLVAQHVPEKFDSRYNFLNALHVRCIAEVANVRRSASKVLNAKTFRLGFRITLSDPSPRGLPRQCA